MPTLNWIGKEAVINHDKEVPFKLLKKVEKYSVGKSENLLVKGDNLEALKALMPYYKGKVKCIYIDPPYNTGNEGWIYNDNVKSEKIKRWLKKQVKIDDLSRHDKWLCMMYPRLKLLRELLRDDGVIFVSIDDNEHCNLKQVFDEIYGHENFVGSIIWQKRKGGGNDSAHIAVDHEYILVYTKSFSLQKKWRISYNEAYLKRYKLSDSLGRYYWDTLSRPGLNNPIVYDVECPDGTIIRGGKWQISRAEFLRRLKEGNVKIERNNKKEWTVFHKVRLPEGGRVFRSIFSEYSNKNAADEMNELFQNKKAFSNPKPSKLVRELVKIVAEKEDIVLDSFAGSGTTGHAVMDLNKEDGGNRKVILVEMEENISKDVTAERLKRAIKKFDYKEGFEFCELDKELFDEIGDINVECSFEQLATYIYFTENKSNIERKKISGNLIGESADGKKEFYLIFKEKHKNRLGKSFLRKLKKNEKQKVIYADECSLGEEEMQEYYIQFKQIPYEVEKY
ncbi:MAG: site-specific DNA-methyltransferase [archaeon]